MYGGVGVGRTLDDDDSNNLLICLLFDNKFSLELTMSHFFFANLEIDCLQTASNLSVILKCMKQST